MSIRGVLDTNIVLAAYRSSARTSPNRELLTRWEAGEYTLLYSDDMALEYVEKLLAAGVSGAEVRQFVASLARLAEKVRIRVFHLSRYPSDADDIAFVLCAINGEATHLVTYDNDFSEVATEYDFTICKPLAFLVVLRSSQAP